MEIIELLAFLSIALFAGSIGGWVASTLRYWAQNTRISALEDRFDSLYGRVNGKAGNEKKAQLKAGAMLTAAQIFGAIKGEGDLQTKLTSVMDVMQKNPEESLKLLEYAQESIK